MDFTIGPQLDSGICCLKKRQRANEACINAQNFRTDKPDYISGHGTSLLKTYKHNLDCHL